MKQISIKLKSDTSTIGYEIDGEQMRFKSGICGPDGSFISEEESGEISDPRTMALRLYWVIKTALEETKAQSNLGASTTAEPVGDNLASK